MPQPRRKPGGIQHGKHTRQHIIAAGRQSWPAPDKPAPVWHHAMMPACKLLNYFRIVRHSRQRLI